jgi:hypothetical protein
VVNQPNAVVRFYLRGPATGTFSSIHPCAIRSRVLVPPGRRARSKEGRDDFPAPPPRPGRQSPSRPDRWWSCGFNKHGERKPACSAMQCSPPPARSSQGAAAQQALAGGRRAGERASAALKPPIPSPPFAAPADQQTSSISSSTCLALGRLLLHDPKDAHPGPDEPLRCIVACPDTVRVRCGRRALKGSLTARVSLLPLAHCCWSMYRTPRPARTQSLWTSRTCLRAYKVMM